MYTDIEKLKNEQALQLERALQLNEMDSRVKTFLLGQPAWRTHVNSYELSEHVAYADCSVNGEVDDLFSVWVLAEALNPIPCWYGHGGIAAYMPEPHNGFTHYVRCHPVWLEVEPNRQSMYTSMSNVAHFYLKVDDYMVHFRLRLRRDFVTLTARPEVVNGRKTGKAEVDGPTNDDWKDQFTETVRWWTSMDYPGATPSRRTFHNIHPVQQP